MTALADAALGGLIERLHVSLERRGLAAGVLGHRAGHGALAMLSRRRAARARQVFAAASSAPPWLNLETLEHLGEQYPHVPYVPEPALTRPKACRRARTLATLLPDFDRHREFLEIGCGDGLVAWNLQQAGKLVTAVDVRDTRLAPEVSGSPVRFHQADAACLDLDDGRFDVVYSFDAFEHFADPDAVFREAIRVLRPGGYLYASFGPLYFSPWGAHQWHCIDVPYCHLLFREDDLDEFAAARGQPRINFSALNGWRIGQYRALWRCAPALDRLRYYEKYDVGHLDLVCRHPSCFRGRTDCFEDLVIRSLEALFRKRGRPS